MIKSLNSNAQVSVMSLISMTAGAVSIAWFVMFIGCFTTMMVIANQTPAIAGNSKGAYDNGLGVVSEQTHTRLMNISNNSQKVEKKYVKDALFRGEGLTPPHASTDKSGNSNVTTHFYHAAVGGNTKLHIVKYILI